ncbi:MAG TPA: hypothetical protein VJJ21_03455 [Candidatus Nanoarchaeia archaeon]|nr:hypothetical protein [Candidatus Nanoarchaeia archaeon]
MIVKDLSGLGIERGEIILRVQHPAENGGGGGNISNKADCFYLGADAVLGGIQMLGKEYLVYKKILEEVLIPRNKHKA